MKAVILSPQESRIFVWALELIGSEVEVDPAIPELRDQLAAIDVNIWHVLTEVGGEDPWDLQKMKARIRALKAYMDDIPF